MPVFLASAQHGSTWVVLRCLSDTFTNFFSSKYHFFKDFYQVSLVGSLKHSKCNTLSSLTETDFRAKYVKGVYLTFQIPCSDFQSKILKSCKPSSIWLFLFGSVLSSTYWWLPDWFIWPHSREFILKSLIFWWHCFVR